METDDKSSQSSSSAPSFQVMTAFSKLNKKVKEANITGAVSAEHKDYYTTMSKYGKVIDKVGYLLALGWEASENILASFGSFSVLSCDHLSFLFLKYISNTSHLQHFFSPSSI